MPYARIFSTRLLALVAPVLVALSALAVVATPASARVVEVGGTKFGVQRHSAPANLFENEGLQPETFANTTGAPVLHQNSTYAIYWDPDFHYLDPWTEVIDQFFQNMSSASGALDTVFAVDTQYTDSTNKPAYYRSAFRGSYADKAVYPTPAGCTDPNPLVVGDAITCLTDKEIREQLESFIKREKLPTGMETIYYLLTPPGVTVCTDEGVTASHCSSNSASANSFCSYHAAITPTNPSTGDKNTILYGVIPWSAGGLGDPLLHASSQTSAYDCQDGGFDPSSKPSEKKEKAKEESEKQKEEKATKEKEMTTEEKEKALRAKELEGPHQQEPNQTTCPNVYDGGCDIGLADIIIGQIASEQQDIVTNPLLNAWQDGKHNEVADECRNVFALVQGGSVTANEESGAGTLFNQSLNGGEYYLNDAFNLSAHQIYQPGGECLNHVNLVPAFTAPTPVNHEEIVGFNGLESNVALDAATSFSGGVEKLTYATYTWNFGDGSAPVSGFGPGAPPCSEVPWRSPCAASVFHSYQYGGNYEVTLTITDTGGNTATVTHPVTVVGPAPPAPPAPPSPPSPPSGGGSSGAATTAGTPGATGSGSTGTAPAPKPTIPGPVASAAAVTRSLSSALTKGLVISYSVNEQVAGQFQVLLASSIAKRIGLHGSAATGMPPGSAPSIVIGKAILITTKGGRNTVKVQFGKKTAAKLRKLRSVPLTIRLIVRNASSRTPQTTTVISTVNLSR
jgi:hypothetical protein